MMCERPPELKIVESRSGTSKDHFGETNAWKLTRNGGKSANEDQEMFTEVLEDRIQYPVPVYSKV